jgi:hypothetical protein
MMIAVSAIQRMCAGQLGQAVPLDALLAADAHNLLAQSGKR